MKKPKYRVYHMTDRTWQKAELGPPLVVEFEEAQYDRMFDRNSFALPGGQRLQVPGGRVYFRKFGVFRTQERDWSGEHHLHRVMEIIIVCTPTPSPMGGPAVQKIWARIKAEVEPILYGMKSLPEEERAWNIEKGLFTRGEGDYVRLHQPATSRVSEGAV